MHPSHDYKYFGGIYLESPELNVFVDPKRGPLERQCVIIFANADQLAELWGKSTMEKTVRPTPIDEWDDNRRQAMVWRLLEGPRHPIEVPFIYHNGESFVTGSSQYQMAVLLDWEAKVIPLMMRPKDVGQIMKLAEIGDGPVIEATNFLADKRETIIAFQKNIPLARLYTGRDAPNEDQIRIDAEDYASLLTIQLETLLVKHRLHQWNTTVVTDEQRDALVQEVRQILYQKGAIAYFLSRDTTSDEMPTWDSADLESKNVALQFLANSRPTQKKTPHLRIVSTNNTGNQYEHAKRPTEMPHHLRVVHGKPEEPL